MSQNPSPLRHPNKITLLPSASSVQVCTRNLLSHPKILSFKKHRWLSRFPVAVWLQVSFEVCTSRHPTHCALPSSCGNCPPVHLCAWPGRIQAAQFQLPAPLGFPCRGGAWCLATSLPGPTDLGFLSSCPTSPTPAVLLARQAHLALGRGAREVPLPCGLQGLLAQEFKPPCSWKRGENKDSGVSLLSTSYSPAQNTLGRESTQEGISLSQGS